LSGFTLMLATRSGALGGGGVGPAASFIIIGSRIVGLGIVSTNAIARSALIKPAPVMFGPPFATVAAVSCSA
jgi:hypothetical protein